jgi:transcriptional regulator with XRE-family HTH domain
MTGYDAGFRQRAAALLRSAANDLKRDEAAAARELGLTEDHYRQLLTGQADPDWPLIRRAAEVWPLNERDLLPWHDDVPLGARIHRLEQSLASARVLQRGGADYYRYRDTAMARVASFRPEHIQMLRVVSDDDPANPAVEWNEGHLLYQFTYFVGPVNYYYSWQGRSFCVPMTTGDSVWGVPFAPHSFTSRDGGQEAYILALTYGGDLLGDCQRELAVLGPAIAGRLALPAGGSGAEGAAATLRSLVRSRLLSDTEAATRSGIDPIRFRQLCEGETEPSWDELVALAGALGVSVRDLLPRHTATLRGVTVQPAATARRWWLPGPDRPAYRIRQLAGDPIHPDTSAFEIAVAEQADQDPELLRSHQHGYLYVLDGGTVRLRWQHGADRHERLLRPGDSAYLLPEVGLSLAALDRPAKVLLLRIGGAVTADVRYALGGLSDRQLRRYLREDRRWYRASGQGAPELEQEVQV